MNTYEILTIVSGVEDVHFVTTNPAKAKSKYKKMFNNRSNPRVRVDGVMSPIADADHWALGRGRRGIVPGSWAKSTLHNNKGR